jgi:hypothetical protein
VVFVNSPETRQKPSDLPRGAAIEGSQFGPNPNRGASGLVGLRNVIQAVMMVSRRTDCEYLVPRRPDRVVERWDVMTHEPKELQHHDGLY